MEIRGKRSRQQESENATSDIFIATLETYHMDIVHCPVDYEFLLSYFSVTFA